MAKNEEIKKKTVSNLAWRFAERCGAQGVTFVVSIVLARLLDPTDYGVISLVTVFTSILQVFVDSGLGNALIQKKDADDLDFSTVFYCNIVFCIVLYTGLFIAAPSIAYFYDNLELIPVIRVLGFTIIISGVKGVQQAYVSRHMIFKRFFFSTLGGTVGAAMIGIVMAYMGFGVWALVVQQIFNATLDTIILWITVKWRPKPGFSYNRFKVLFSFGWKLLVSSLINTVYNDIRQLIIGKVYSSSDLAYYNRGKQFPNLIVENINTSIDSVLLPTMSKVQHNKERIKTLTRRSIMTSSYIMWPLMFGLMATGRNIVNILLTDKWLPCLPFLYIFCFVYGMQPIHTANLNAIKAIGRSDLYLKMEVIKKSVGIVMILATMNISVFAIGLSSIFYTLFASIVNAFPNRKLLEYSYAEQFKDIIPSFVLAGMMCVVISILPLGNWNVFLQLFIQIMIGGIVYISGSIIFKLESFKFVLNSVKGFMKKSL